MHKKHFFHFGGTPFVVLGILSLTLECATSLGAKADIPVVLVEQIKESEISEEISYPARVVSLVNASVLSETPGIVKDIRVHLGTNVKKNQALLRIQHTDPVFKYAPVTVRAPVAGVVSDLSVTLGSNVSTGTALLTITNPKKLQLHIEVPAIDLMKIQRGLRGSFKAVGESYSLSVSVKGVSPFVDPTTGTATAELRLDEPFEKRRILRPGLVGSVHFKTARRKGFELTEDAVVYRGKNTFVRVVENQKAKLTPVRLGRSQRGIVEILEGVGKGDVVVVRASQFIADGDEVAVESPKTHGE